MSTTQKSVNDVIAFLDHLDNKSIVPKNTVVGRKVAAKKFFDGLDPEEQSVGYVDENFDVLYERFKNKNALSFKGNSLEVYKSRVRNVIKDFFQWSDDPAAWERSLNSKKPTKSAGVAKANKPKVSAKENVEPPKMDDSATATPSGKRRHLFPLSPGVEVAVEFPVDGLTMAELSKLGMFLFPYCKDITPERLENSRWPMISGPDSK